MKFLSTIWDTIQRAKARDTNAMQQIVEKYRTPVLKFIKTQGFSNEDAEDLSQEVFIRLFSESTLSSIDRSKGRFRNLLITIIKNTIRDELKRIKSQKRGADVKFVPIESTEAEPQADTDEEFDRLWVFNLIDIALRKLKKECDENKTRYYEILSIYQFEGLDYTGIAKRLAITIHDVKSYIHRAKLKLIEYLKSDIAEYSTSHEDLKTELDYLLKLINISS